MKKLFSVVCLISIFASGLVGPSVYGDVLLAPTPPMGWNSWNWWGKHEINEQVVRDTIDAMAEKGLLEAGYEYIVVDGGWRHTKLGEDGRLLAHPEKFPSGIKALADYAHSKGFKFGLHAVPGSHDCGGDPVGAWGVEEVHFAQFVEWGLDFVKLDRCQLWLAPKPDSKADQKRVMEANWSEGDRVKATYGKWREMLDASGRSILLSASAYNPFEWYADYAQMGRTTGDIGCHYHGGAKFDDVPPKHASVMENAEENNEVADLAGDGYWNDPDMLVTGEQGLTQEQQKAHFALWCIMTSPLMLGSDPISMTQDELDIVANKTAIAINQDPNEQGRRISDTGDEEVWAKRLSNGDVAVLLLNRSKTDAKRVAFQMKLMGLKGKYVAHDVYAGAKLGTFNGSIDRRLNPSSGLFLLLKQ